MEFKLQLDTECIHKSECTCQSIYSGNYSYEEHTEQYLKLSNKTHKHKLTFVESCMRTKTGILKAPAENNYNYSKIKESILKAMSGIKKEFYDWIEKAREINQEDKKRWLDPQLASIIKYLRIKPENILNINTLIEEVAEILRCPIHSELEMNSRKNCPEYKSTFSVLYDPLKKTWQEYFRACHQSSYVYNFIEKDSRTNLYIYDTETGSKDVKILQTHQPLNTGTCIIQLPNNALFCFGKTFASGITLIIDSDYQYKVLASGDQCCFSSGVYFRNNVYCFGGCNNGSLGLSSRFNLNENIWIQLIPMPRADYECISVLFKGNILISGWRNRNIVLYSIDVDNFSIIPYDFAINRRKIMVVSERLYLIECPGSIYESEVGNEYGWDKIADSPINYHINQVCCSYNKGGVYIGGTYSNYEPIYFKFDLIEKRLTELL